VGVVSDTDTGRLYSREGGIAYVPFTQHYEPRLFVFARTADDPADLAPQLFTLARQVDPEMAIDGVGTATMVLAGEYVLFSVLAAVASTLAGVALLLAMAGLYGVLSHLVSQRGREMAVRLALGADPSRIRAMVLRQGLTPVVEGLVVGLVLGTACELMLRSNRGPLDAPLAILDPAVLASVLAPPLIAGFVACYVPARRASRANPVVALKEL
jgi:putative ABC transport system permease protein